MSHQELRELTMVSGRRLIAAINQGDLGRLKEFSISDLMWEEISEYIQESPGPHGHALTEAPGLVMEDFSVEDERGQSGVSGRRRNVHISRTRPSPEELAGDFLANYIVEFPVCIGGVDEHTLIFDVFLTETGPRIGYRLLEVM